MTHEELIEKVAKGVFGLKWVVDDDGDAIAETPFGTYVVQHRKYRGWTWGFCFQEYYDEDESGCGSFEDGKAAAQSNYNERVSAQSKVREAIKITGEVCADSLKEVAGDSCDQMIITTLLGAAETIQFLTQGKET